MDAITCPECGHVGDEAAFQDHIGEAPDLFDTYLCPDCEHIWDHD